MTSRFLKIVEGVFEPADEAEISQRRFEMHIAERQQVLDKLNNGKLPYIGQFIKERAGHVIDSTFYMEITDINYVEINTITRLVYLNSRDSYKITNEEYSVEFSELNQLTDSIYTKKLGKYEFITLQQAEEEMEQIKRTARRIR